MPFQQNIQTINYLTADQAVTNSIAPVDITGFSINMAAASRLHWELDALFTLGASGGFRFLANGPAAPSVYNALFNVIPLGTQVPEQAGQVVEAAFVNLSGLVFAQHCMIKASGNIIAGIAGTFSMQFAQNTANAVPITILAGAVLKIYQH